MPSAAAASDVREIPLLPTSAAAGEVREQPPPLWRAPVVRACKSLLQLPAGWDNGGARPVDPETLLTALNLLVKYADRDTPPPDLIPTISGGVQMEWHREGLDIEVEVVSPQRIELYYLDHRTQEEWEGSIFPYRQYVLKAQLAVLTERHAPTV